MNTNNTLFILDWDNTLFPTSWILNNNIDIYRINNYHPYMLHFVELDNMIYRLLVKLVSIGRVVIVTNASLEWILTSFPLLPRTSQYIKKFVHIISANDRYQYRCPVNDWKKCIFNYDISHIISTSKQVISIGDSEYEYNALVNLSVQSKHKNKLLKSVKLVSTPDYDTLMDQLNVLTKSAYNICEKMRHLDLIFKKN